MILSDELTEQELDEMVLQGTREERRAIAKHPNASLQNLLTLAQMGFAEDVEKNPLLLLHVEGASEAGVEILVEIARQTTREERLEELASSSWQEVRRAVAWNKSTPALAFFSLARDESEFVRRIVARNSMVPSELLTLLSKDDVDEVREGVASNTRTRQDTLEILAKDPNDYVRIGVAKNPIARQDTLRLLINDESEHIRMAAKASLAKLRKAPR
jgi:hypothetical protein